MTCSHINNVEETKKLFGKNNLEGFFNTVMYLVKLNVGQRLV